MSTELITPEVAPTPTEDKSKPRRKKKKLRPERNGKPAKGELQPTNGQKKKAAPTEGKSTIASIKALERSIKTAPSQGGATYASRMDRGGKPGVAAFLISRLRKASKSKPVTKNDLYDAMKKKFPDRRPLGLWITLSDYISRNLKKRHGIELSGTPKDGLWIKGEKKPVK